jgi:hypothetical protein
MDLAAATTTVAPTAGSVPKKQGKARKLAKNSLGKRHYPGVHEATSHLSYRHA